MNPLHFQTSGITNPSYTDSLWVASNVPKLRDNDSQAGSRGYMPKAVKCHLRSLSGKPLVEHGSEMSYLTALFKFGQMLATAVGYAPRGSRNLDSNI